MAARVLNSVMVLIPVRVLTSVVSLPLSMHEIWTEELNLTPLNVVSLPLSMQERLMATFSSVFLSLFEQQGASQDTSFRALP